MSPKDTLENISIRDYQSNIIDIACKKNTIVYLPTGTGKTLIAVMVIKKLGGALNRPLSEGGKISIMLANTTALVDQHADYLKRLIPFNVGVYSGSACNKTWSKTTWKQKLDKFQVFVMTPRALCNILSDTILSINEINLIILDECHRATHNHPMSVVMERFAKNASFPRILGLTATLLNKNCNPVNVIADIKELEKNLQSEIVTVEPHHTKQYSTNPREIVKTYLEEKTSGIVENAVHELSNLLTVIENFKPNSIGTSSAKVLKEFKSLIQDTIVQIETFGIYGGKIAIKLRMNQLLDYTKIANLDESILVIKESTLTILSWIYKLFKSEIRCKGKTNLLLSFSNRVITLLDILNQHKNIEKAQFCAIVFVNRRLTVKILYQILMKLKSTNPAYADINPNFVLGSNSGTSTKSSLLGLYKAKVYKGIIQQFCNRHINLLVASNVLEEGIDVPTCSLIINFDEPKNYRGYVQSKGRARSNNSNYYVMISQSSHTTFTTSYESFRQTQEILQEYFSEKAICCSDLATVENENVGDDDIQITKATPHCGTNTATDTPVKIFNNAVNRINLYCSSLPHDKYTTYVPKWLLEKQQLPTSSLYKAILRLPIICQYLGLVEGPYMQSEQLAINATALKTCNILKDKGELDDNWLPKPQTETDEENQHFFQHWTKFAAMDMTLKTNLHKKMAAKVLQQQIESSKPSFIHIIKLKPQFDRGSMGSSQFYLHDHYSSSTMFGFVTAQALPEICDFNIYVPEGIILVTVMVNKLLITLTTKQIHDLRVFHYYIFKNVLGILQDFLIFDNDQSAEMMLMIPVYEHYDTFGLNFDILRLSKQLLVPKSDNTRNKCGLADLLNKSLLGKVVNVPTTSENYLVYLLSDSGQLRGKLISNNIDYLKTSNEKIVVNYDLNPALCLKQEFPTDLWIQAFLLPTTLYRIQRILQAEELRYTIMVETGLGNTLKDKKWMPLSFKNNPSKISANLTQIDSSIISMKFDLDIIHKRAWISQLLNDPNHAFIYHRIILSQLLLKEEMKQQKRPPLDNPTTMNYEEIEIKLFKPKIENNGPELIDVMKAITGIRCDDILNYERVETLGDSFLKFCVSLFIVLRYPDYTEGKATVLKSSIISNKNLFYIGLDNNLFKYVKNSRLTTWKPPGFTVPLELKTKLKQKELSIEVLSSFNFTVEEKVSGILVNNLPNFVNSNIILNEEIVNSHLDYELLTNKTIADSVEALLGIYFESCGFLGGLQMLTWLKIMPPSENIENLFNMSLTNPLLKHDATLVDINLHLPSSEKIEAALGYKFNNPAYLLQAVSHSSYNWNYLTDCYQRLEFLGDAVLDFLITCHIYETYKTLDPGELTDLRSALVNNVTFAGFTVRCGFYKYLLLSNECLLQSIDKFVEFQESHNFVIKNDNVLILSEENIYMAEHIEVPKALGDIFESLAAAVFLDCGMNLQIVWKVFYRIMWKEIESFAKNVPKNDVRLLYEALQAKPHYHKPVSADNELIMVALDISLSSTERPTIYGFGENKKCAKKAAAKLALRLLQKNEEVI